MIYRLPDDDFIFPNPADAEEDGLLAIGGDLEPGRLLEAYSHGIFPWFSEGDPIFVVCTTSTLCDLSEKSEG